MTYGQPVLLIMIKCKQCGKEFSPNAPNQKFCCEYCTNRFFSQRLNRQRREGTWIRKKQEPKVVFKEEDYKQNFKNYCVSCGKPIKVNWKWYLNYGNYCQECCVGAEKQSKKLNEPIKTLRKALVEIGANK